MTESNTTELAAVKASAVAPLSIKDTVLAQFRDAEAVVMVLADRYRNVAYDVKTPKGMKEAIAARADLRDNGRLFLTRAEARIKGEVNDLKRVMAEEVERLVGVVKPIEEAVDQQIKAEEQRKAAEKAERERIEAERVAGHRTKIDKLKSYVERAKGQPLEAIEHAASVLEAFPIGSEYEEFQDEAQAARTSTVDALRAMAAAERDRIQKEQEAARLAKELADAKAELEALRAAKAPPPPGAAPMMADGSAADPERFGVVVIDFAEDSPLESVIQAEATTIKRGTLPADTTATPGAVERAMSDALTAGTGIVSVEAESVKHIDPATVRNEATIKLGDINARLAPIQISQDGLESLGFRPVNIIKNARLYHEADFPLICAAIAKHVMAAS